MSNQHRQATQDASHKGHLMGHWQETGKFLPGTRGEIIVNLGEVRRFYADIPKVTYCARCGRSITATPGGVTGTALDYECDASPMHWGIGVLGLKQLGVGR